MYKFLIRPILFKFNPEKSHYIVFNLIKFLFKFWIFRKLTKLIYHKKDARLERNLFGLKFPNPVGLAAGFDKDANLIDELSLFGFGFIEIGTITPQSQPGNPKPRLFRFTESNSLINHMGLNNLGVEEAIKKLKLRKSKIIVGGNIGKNTNSGNIIEDYIYSYQKLFDWVDYFAINISCPNIGESGQLADKDFIIHLLNRLRDIDMGIKKPILLKISPDLSQSELDDVIDIVSQTGIDAVIATNTVKVERGGLSGEPIRDKSTKVIRYLWEKSNKTLVIIGVGGIMTPEDAIEKLEAGASLIQIYTGFIWEGPGLIKRINNLIIKRTNLI